MSISPILPVLNHQIPTEFKILVRTAKKPVKYLSINGPTVPELLSKKFWSVVEAVVSVSPYPPTTDVQIQTLIKR